MTDLAIAWTLAIIAFVLFVLSLVRLHNAKRDAKRDAEMIARIEEAVKWNPAGAKYPPTLTDAEVEEFHRMRWDGD
jgi:hypothetical protein